MVNKVIVVWHPPEGKGYQIVVVDKFDWLSRPIGLELEKAVWQVCSARSEDHIGQVSEWLDIGLGENSITIINRDKTNVDYDGKHKKLMLDI